MITGASSGIGRAIALTLANHENTIYLTGRSEEKLKQVKAEVEQKGAKCFVMVGDIQSTVDCNKVVQDAIEKMGSINVLVANAGVGVFKNIEDFTDEDYDSQFNTNVKGVFAVLRPVVRHMKVKQEGQIIVTSSNLGFRTGARCALYAATKHAVQAMVGSIREELKGTGVKAATINPGAVDTPWFDGKDVDRSRMLDVHEVAKAAITIITQAKSSDIEHILINPTNRR